jgi:predicted TIM-barrel fold metal-dependent hydrolase
MTSPAQAPTDTTPAADDRTKWIVSVDDHLFEPPDLWTRRLPAEFRDRAPHTRYDEKLDALLWEFEGYQTPLPNTLVQAGTDREALIPRFIRSYDELGPWCYDPKARLRAMDQDGVLASLCFPMFPRFCGQTFNEAVDKELALACLQTYNDWLTEEWAGDSDGRLLPLIIIPLWDPKLAAAEIERTVAAGAKAIAFSENPSKLGLPSLHDESNYWDPVFAAANDTGTPLCIHFGSSSTVPTTSPDAPLLVSGSLSPISLAFACVDWLFSGKLIDDDRQPFPNLKICLSEGGIGWIPYMLERCDDMVRTRPFAARGDFKIDLAQGGFGIMREKFGCEHLDRIGIDNVMMEADFPHGDSTFPRTRDTSAELLHGYSPEVQYQVRQGNARRVFNLTSGVFA